MLRRQPDSAFRNPGTRTRTAMGAMGLGLYLLGGLSGVGCGVGTDPSLLANSDSNSNSGVTADAATMAPDADPSVVPDGLPPIDQRTYEETAVATFALG